MKGICLIVVVVCCLLEGLLGQTQICQFADFESTPGVELGSSGFLLSSFIQNERICIRVQSTVTANWIAIGIAKSGAMVNTPKSNAVVYLSGETPQNYIIGGYSTFDITKQVDQSSISVFEVSQQNGKLEFTFERTLAAATENDVAIDPEGETTIIWAHGTDTQFPVPNHGKGDRQSSTFNFQSGKSANLDLHISSSTALVTISLVIISVVIGLVVTKVKIPFFQVLLSRRIGCPPEKSFVHTVTLDFVPSSLDLLYGEVLYVIYFIVGFVVVMELASSDFEEVDTDKRKWALVTGHLSIMNLMFSLLGVSRLGLWEIAFGISFERVVKFHRWVSRLFLVTGLIHLLLTHEECEGMWSNNACGTQSVKPMNGSIAFFSFASMALMAVEPIRRNFFEFFYYFHRIASPVGIVFILLHSKTTKIVLIFPLAFYIGGYLARWIRTKKHTVNTVKNLEDCTIVTLKSTEKLTEMATRMEPSSFFLVNIPSVSYLEYHPFSAICTQNGEKFGFCMKKMNPKNKQSFTSKIQDKLAPGATITLEGPYGRFSYDTSNLTTMVLIAGGVGITPMLSILNKRRSDKRLSKIANFVLIWTVQHPHQLLACEDLMVFDEKTGNMGSVNGMEECSASTVSTHYFVSRAQENGEMPFKSESNPHSTINYQAGRPKLLDIISVLDLSERVGMVACGPDGMVKYSQKIAHRNGILFHKEVFSW